MLDVVTVLLWGLAAFYAVFIGWLAIGFRRVRRECPPAFSPERRPTVSVIVPARNEAERILQCLQSVAHNDYPPDRFEIIVVDDFSSDTTATRVRALIDAAIATPGPRLRLLSMHEHAEVPTGRKQDALHVGISAARGEIIMTTDADCRVRPGWIRSMTSAFTRSTGFVAGPVRYDPGPTLFGRFQALEFMALVATGAGGMGMGRPNMCNGANVAYRRAVYLAHGAHLDGPAADEVLAQHLARHTSWAVRFCGQPDAVVETQPLLRFRAFWRQRRRWAGTGPRYPGKPLVATILTVYAFYVVLLATALALPLAPALTPSVLGVLGLKMGSELLLLAPACIHFGQQRLLRYYVIEQPLQVFYVVMVGVAAIVAPPAWKPVTTSHD